MVHAAALTYTTLFAVVPLMTVTYGILSTFPAFHGVGERIENFVFTNFVPSASAVVQNYLQTFTQQAKNLTGIGIAFLLVTSFMMLRTIDLTVNRIWQVSRVRKGLSGILLYWSILTLGPLMLCTGFLLTSYLSSIRLDAFMVNPPPLLLDIEGSVLVLMPALSMAIALALLYTAVPNRKVPLLNGIIGAVVVALLIQTAKFGFTHIIAQSPTYISVYGAFAAVPLFLIWVYLIWMFILLGAVMVRTMDQYGQPDFADGDHPLFSLLAILKLMSEEFAEGHGISFKYVRKNHLPISLEHWEQHTELLHSLGYIIKNDAGQWMLSKDLRSVDFADFCESLPWPLPSSNQLSKMDFHSNQAWCGDLIDRLKTVNEARRATMTGSLDDLFTQTRKEASLFEP